MSPDANVNSSIRTAPVNRLRLLGEADAYQKLDRLGDATNVLDRILEAYPDDLAALRARARLAIHASDTTMAARLLPNLAKVDFALARRLLLLLQKEKNFRDAGRAIKLLQDAVGEEDATELAEEAKRVFRYLSVEAKGLIEDGNTTEALQVLRIAHQLQPDAGSITRMLKGLFEARVETAKKAAADGKTAKAYEAFISILKEDPENQLVLNELVKLMVSADRHKEANVFLRYLAGMNSIERTTLNTLLDSMIQRDNIDELVIAMEVVSRAGVCDEGMRPRVATKAARIAREQFKNKNSLRAGRLAIAAKNLGSEDVALDNFLKRASIEALSNFRSALKSKDDDEISKAYAVALPFVNSNDALALLVAQYLNNAKDPVAAEAIFRRLYESGARTVPVLGGLTRCLLAQRRLTETLDVLVEWLKTSPADPNIPRLLDSVRKQYERMPSAA